MKTRLTILAAGLACGLSLGVFRASANLEVSEGVSIHATTEFYEPLAPSGTWVEVGSYGRCWHPAGVAADWRPYCNGNWEWTDSGWYWVSDEPWAWACYHYGTWAYDSGQGWVWVPGIEWAPAWVNWRMGGDYVGWVPCSPPGFVVTPSYYVFVKGLNFRDQIRPNTVIINNRTIFNHTTETAAARHKGPGVNQIEKATGKKFAAVSVREVDRRTSASIPEKFKNQTAEPANTERPATAQPRPGPAEHQVTPNENPQMPDRNLRPNNNPNNVTPDNVQQNKEIPQERIVPPPSHEAPVEKRAPKEVVPPHQASPPSSPEKPRENPNQGGGQGGDKDKDNGGGHGGP